MIGAGLARAAPQAAAAPVTLHPSPDGIAFTGPGGGSAGLGSVEGVFLGTGFRFRATTPDDHLGPPDLFLI